MVKGKRRANREGSIWQLRVNASVKRARGRSAVVVRPVI